MNWKLFGQIVGLLVLLWLMIPTVYASINDKRYQDALRRKQAGVFHVDE